MDALRAGLHHTRPRHAMLHRFDFGGPALVVDRVRLQVLRRSVRTHAQAEMKISINNYNDYFLGVFALGTRGYCTEPGGESMTTWRSARHWHGMRGWQSSMRDLLHG